MLRTTIKAQQNNSSWNDPDEFASLHPDANRLRFYSRMPTWRPPTDAYETEDTLVVRVEIAGMRESDFLVTLEDQYLLIRGVRPDSAERKAYHQMEIPFGEFSTEVELPFPVVAERIEAVYRDGFLRVVLPKAQPHQVTVNE
jgi:HSP20 family protein